MNLKIETIGESTFYNTRTLSINFKGKVIKTPLRALTYQENKAKSNVPDDILMDAVFSVIFKKYSLKEVQNLLGTNEYPKRQLNSIEEEMAKMQHSQIIISILQPPKSVIKESSFDKDKYLRITSNIQKEAGLKFLSFPWLDYSGEDLLKRFREFDSYCGTESEPVFVLDIGTDPIRLEKILPYISELALTQRINFIGLLYKKKRDALLSYDILWKKLKELNLGVILLDISREDLDNLSGTHLQEFVLGDILSLTTSKAFHSGVEENKDLNHPPKIKIPINKRFKIFNRDDLKITPVEKFKINSSWIQDVSNCFTRSSHIKQALENYSEAEDDEKKEAVLRSISKAHEFLSSSKELNGSRGYINKNEIDYYLSTKQALLDGLKKY